MRLLDGSHGYPPVIKHGLLENPTSTNNSPSSKPPFTMDVPTFFHDFLKDFSHEETSIHGTSPAPGDEVPLLPSQMEGKDLGVTPLDPSGVIFVTYIW